MELDVVGLGFRMTRDGRQALKGIVDKHAVTGMRVSREPDNPKDPNAVKVSLPARLMGGAKIGYLRRDTAELLADDLDAGRVRVKSAKLVEVTPEPNQGASARLKITLEKKTSRRTSPAGRSRA
jgi:hypothetical protein